MGDRKLVPARRWRREIRVVNSRFIATLAPAFSVEEARAFIAEMRAEFHDATHNVPAFVIGHPPSVITHSGDDGEPSGTAGRPALAVLQGSGLGDAVVVVTRYFGGTKLGTGGLVRAYGDAVRAVLADAPLAEKAETWTALLACPYALYEPIERLVARHRGEIIEREFAADVTLTLRFRPADFQAFAEAVRERSAGRCEPLVIERNPETLIPLEGARPS